VDIELQSGTIDRITKEFLELYKGKPVGDEADWLVLAYRPVTRRIILEANKYNVAVNSGLDLLGWLEEWPEDDDEPGERDPCG
jgi:hypothetical protein